MSTHTDSHAATTPAPDVVGVDYGTMNRELLAEKLAATYYSNFNLGELSGDLRASWLRVVDVAITELQGTPNA